MTERIAHWRRLSDCDALAGAPLGDALKEACDALERVEKLCRDLETGAGAMRVDVPHWVISVRSALRGPDSSAPARTPVTAGTEARGETTEAQEARE